MNITSEEHNKETVQALILLLKQCDGETLRHVLDESGQTEYAFNNVLRDRCILWEHVGCLDNIVDLVQRIGCCESQRVV